MEISRVLKEGGGVQLVIAPRRMFCTAAALRLRLAIAMVTPPDQIPAEVAQMQVRRARSRSGRCATFCSLPPLPNRCDMPRSSRASHAITGRLPGARAGELRGDECGGGAGRLRRRRRRRRRRRWRWRRLCQRVGVRQGARGNCYHGSHGPCAVHQWRSVGRR